MCIDEELYEELVTAMETTGWFGADAWYMNHARNKVGTSDLRGSSLATFIH
jgi:hypothetical protein